MRVHLGRRDRQGRPRVEFLSRLLELGHHEETEKECRHHVDRDHRFIPLHFGELGRRDARVGDEDINTIQFSLGTRCELLHAAVVGHVELPYLDHAFAAAGRLLDVFFGGVALFEAAHCEDQGVGSEAGEVAGCFLSKADIAASYDDGSALVGTCGVGESLNELAVEEAWERHSRDLLEDVLDLFEGLFPFNVVKYDSKLGCYNVTLKLKCSLQ